MKQFEDGRYYVMSPPGEKWSDYEGPFDSLEDATDHLSLFQDNPSPEMLRMAVVHFHNGVLDLCKKDGEPINLAYIMAH